MRNALLAVLVLAVGAGGLWAAEDSSLPHREASTGIVFPKTLGSMQGGSVTTYDKPELGISVRYSTPGFFKADVYVYDGGIKNLGTGIAAEAVKPHFEQVQEVLAIFEEQGKYKDVTKVSEWQTVLVVGWEKTPESFGCGKCFIVRRVHVGVRRNCCARHLPVLRCRREISCVNVTLQSSGKQIPALIACYEYSEVPGGQDVEYEGKRVSYILLTAYKDNFLKVRFTFPEKDKSKGDELLKKLQADLGGLLK
jgi:hypothetical protein